MGGGLFLMVLAAAGAQPGCMKLVSPVEAGAYPTRADLAPADCAQPAAAAFVHDRTAGSVRALRDLAAGEIVASVPLSSVAGIRPGQPLVIEAHVGPVVVRRQVEALQAARPGEKLFVKAAEGAPFAIPYPEDAQ
jgi:hypothetical protein